MITADYRQLCTNVCTCTRKQRPEKSVKKKRSRLLLDIHSGRWTLQLECLPAWVCMQKFSRCPRTAMNRYMPVFQTIEWKWEISVKELNTWVLIQLISARPENWISENRFWEGSKHKINSKCLGNSQFKLGLVAMVLEKIAGSFLPAAWPYR